MNSEIGFFRRNLLLSVALGSSLLLLAVGLVLISNAPAITNDSAAVSADTLAKDEAAFDIPPLPEIDQNPPADLPSLQAALTEMSNGVMPTGQSFTPEVIAEALATVDVGSETWCDILLIKNDVDWTEDETTQFAQHCI